MSPYNVRSSSTTTNIITTTTITSAIAANAPSTSWSVNDYFMDPFGSSAPSPSPFSLLTVDKNNKQSFQQRSPYLFQTNNSYQLSQKSVLERQQHQQQQKQQQENYFNDVNDFILPSSLNDLLTPTELRKQQLSASSSVASNWDYLSSSHHNNRQPSYELSSSSRNVPFYNGMANSNSNYGYEDVDQLSRYFSSNAINIPGGHHNNMRPNSYNQQDFLPIASNTFNLDEDGPFIMEDTATNSCTETDQEQKLFIYNT
jgi:hypothetical protein